MLERRGEGGRLFQVALFRADGTVHRLEIGTGAPLRDPARIRKLFEERLAVLGDACDPGFGYDMVRLSALATERTDPAQTGLAGDDHAEELAHLIDRLGARFGLRRVSRLMPQDTHIPEYAVASVPAHAPTADCHLRRRRSSRTALRRAAAVAPVRTAGARSMPSPRCRTVRRPVFLAVNMAHVIRLRRSEGPERIAMEWWRDDRGNKLTRDYFRVESEARRADVALSRGPLRPARLSRAEVPHWWHDLQCRLDFFCVS